MLPYNQPKFCSNATWDSNATTFANSSTVGSGQAVGLYVDEKNTVYVADQANNRIQAWFNSSVTPSMTLYGNLSQPISIFVTTMRDIYVFSSSPFFRLDQLIPDANKSVPLMFVNGQGNCFGLFVDISNSIYCAIDGEHKVVKKWLNDSSSTWMTVAGTGSSGSAANMLCYPNGIFVDVNFDLYVTDCYNARIQLFRYGEMNALTVAGSTTLSPTIALLFPTAVVLDADKYVFIVDNNDQRIVGQDANGFRCLVGCSEVPGSSPSELSYPKTLYFDSYGNMFVTDQYNSRVQKFTLNSNSCGMFDFISLLAMEIAFSKHH